MDTSVQMALRTQGITLWLIVGLLVVNLLVSVGSRAHADGDAVQKVQISGPVEIKIVTDPNAKALPVSITEWATKPLLTKESK